MCCCTQAEVGELFDAVDVERRGELSRAELAAGLIDWKAFQVGVQRAHRTGPGPKG